MNTIWHYSPLLAVLLTPIFAANADELQAQQYGDFTDYVLALSWQTGFCQSQHERRHREPDECRLQKEPANKADFLTVHGLWPGLPKSIAARGVDQRRWQRFGCATRPIPNLPEVKASRKCSAPAPGLSPDIATALKEVMPGAGGNSCLERYEYAKHGACFGFDPNAYFGTMIRLDKAIKDSALGQFLLQDAGQSVCYLRMENLEFLSRHYGMQMRVHCEREVFRVLQPLLLEKEKIFHLPGSELLLVLTGPETEARLQYMLNVLNNRKIYWNNTGLDMEYGASWGTFDGRQETLQPLLGQLSWLAEQSCSHRRVLALTQSIEAASGQTTERVLRLQKIRQALERGALVLYAQPIRDAQGKGYDEILTRLRCDDGIMMPNQFIPLIAQFNLSVRFDMQVMEALLQWLSAHPSAEQGARFSVNLMPLTLLQKETASRIMQLFKRYGVPPASVIIEITEEQAFSHSEISMHNINQLRKFGLKIAIDDFGTGYANYERLKRLKADIIKIDGCFVKDILTDSLDAMIVKSITDLAKAKSLSVVAEFVETPAQRDLLLQLGVHSLQGYLIGRPRPLGK